MSLPVQILRDAPVTLPRIYASFAEFERDERARLGLPPLPAMLPEPSPEPSPAADPGVQIARLETQLDVRSADAAAVKPRRRSKVTSRPNITPEALRAEGVLEVGRAEGTNVLYVRTCVKLHLLHAAGLPDRRLDDYAVSLAVRWIEDCGLPSYEVASNLGVNETTLRQALLAAGHERSITTSPATQKRGNRRRRFMRRVAAEIAAP